MIKLFEFLLLLASIFALLPSNLVFANAGLPMIIVGLPNLVFALFPVVLIESLYLKKTLNIDFMGALKGLGFANLVTTIVGFPLTWSCLFGLQMLFSTILGGSCKPGFDNLASSLITVLTHAAWLCPWDDNMHWLIPLALIQCLIVAYFVSAKMEAWIMCKIFKKHDKDTLSQAVWRANSITYAILIGINLFYLVYQIYSKL